MTMLTTRLSAIALASLVLVSACGEDTILEPTFGEGCILGSLTPGQTVTGSLNAASCRQTYHWYTDDVMPYESWNVHLEKGKAYMFYLQQAPDPAQDGLNDVDPVLTMYGKDPQGRSIPLAVSDDEANGINGHNSEFWFVAPRSGDFVIQAGSFDWESFGGYRLTMQSCPVLGTLDTTGTYTFAAPSSPCLRHSYDPSYGTELLLAYSFIRVPADSFETVYAHLEHESADIMMEMGGPDFDTYANIYAESDYDDNDCCSVSVTMDEIPGMVTIAVGTRPFNVPGDYTVEFERTPATAPPATRKSFDGQLTLKPTFPSAKKHR